MDYSNEFLAGLLGGTYVITMVMSSLVGLVFMLLQAFAIMTIAKNHTRGARWIAFIPFAGTYLFGQIVDDISDKNGKRTNYRISLLVLQIIISVGIFPLIFTFFAAIGSYAAMGISDAAAGMMLFYVLGMLVLSALSIVYAIFTFIGLYRIYKTYSPNLAVLLLVLSIFIPFAQPIALFVIKNNNPQVYNYMPNRMNNNM